MGDFGKTPQGPGVFITFEGDDGVGKSTHINFLADVLESHGFEVLRLREPGGTAIGESLRALVLDAKNEEMSPEAELLIYEAARAQIVAEVIKPALSRGAVVLCDRFTDSTVAYQGFGRGLEQGFISAANSFAIQGVVPDRTLIFTVPGESRDKRMRKRADEGKTADRLEAAGDEFHSRVSAAFKGIAASDSERVRVIDASGLHSETARAIFLQVADLFPWITEDTPEMRQMLADFDAEHDHSGDADAADDALAASVAPAPVAPDAPAPAPAAPAAPAPASTTIPKDTHA